MPAAARRVIDLTQERPVLLRPQQEAGERPRPLGQQWAGRPIAHVGADPVHTRIATGPYRSDQPNATKHIAFTHGVE